MRLSRRSLLGAGPAILAARAARAGTLTQTANFRIISWNLKNGTLSIHGSYPASGTPPLPKRYDYTLDGGQHWVAAGEFAMDSGAWDSWVYGLSPPPGQYTLAIRDHADPARIAVAPGSFTVTANSAPERVRFEPVPLSTALPEGFPAGELIAEGGHPHFPLVLHLDAASSPGFTVAPIADGHWQLRIASPGPRAGTRHLTGTIASDDRSMRFAVTFPVRPGRRLASSLLQFTPAPGLSNATAIGSPAFMLAMHGHAGGSFAILAQDAPANPGRHMRARYALDGAAGQTANTLSAGTETLRLTWSNGEDVCVADHALTVTDTIGTGPKLAVSGPNALAGVMGRVSSDPLGRYRGATITLAPGTYISGWLMPQGASGWNDDSFFGPTAFQGAPGVMPVLAQPGTWIQNAKGWLETFGWDVDIAGLEFANLAQSYPGEVGNFAGIKLNAGVLGRTRIRAIYAHNCTNGVLGGEAGQIVLIEDSEFAKCGGGDGFTHNFYIANVTRATIRRVLSWGANVGHCGKIRAQAGLIEDCVFADGTEGSASYLLDLPDGGAHVVRGTLFEKGPHAQNNALLRYGEECQSRHPVNTLLVEGCTFINRTGTADRLYNGYTVNPVGVQVALASHGPAQAVVRDCKFYGFTRETATHIDAANVTLRMEGQNLFLPLSAAPAPASYMGHPFARLGYRSGSGGPGPYTDGPRKGR